jgi:hypothetical protein
MMPFEFAAWTPSSCPHGIRCTSLVRQERHGADHDANAAWNSALAYARLKMLPA